MGPESRSGQSDSQTQQADSQTSRLRVSLFAWRV